MKNQLEITSELYQYIIDTTVIEAKELRIIREEQSSTDDIILQITAHQGQFLTWLIKLLNPKKTIDIGTYKGYSSLCVALASQDKCKTITIDKNEHWSQIARSYFFRSGMENKIESKLGDAKLILNEMISQNQEDSFDFIFIDADKASYLEYYEASLQLVKKGGIIAIDNTLYFGTVIDAKISDNDVKKWIFEDGIKAIKLLNQIIHQDIRVESCLLPMADGLTLVRKR